MSFTNFYIDGSGSNLNAGSVKASAAAYTSASGNWSTVTNIFTPTDGQTTSTKVAIGDWVSLFLNAASITPFIGQVTLVAAGVNGAITVSSTIKSGTAPITGTGTVTCRAGGSWATPLILGATGIAPNQVLSFSMKVNVKQATYSSLATQTIGLKGDGLTILFWLDGYNANPGDLDNDTTNTLTKPTWSFSAAATLTASANQIISNIIFTGSVSATFFVGFGGQNSQAVRCRFENTSSNAAAIAANTNASGGIFAYCWFKCPTTATTTGVVNVNSTDNAFLGCIFEAGGKAGANINATRTNFIQCVFLNNTGNGILVSGTNSNVHAIQCTIAGSTSDGIAHTGGWGVTDPDMIIACLFTSITGWGYSFTGAANKTFPVFYCNDFYSCSLGHITGVGDQVSWFEQSETVNPIISSTNVNLNPQGKAVGHGFPGIFENNITINVPPIGAAGLTTVFPGNIGGVFGA